MRVVGRFVIVAVVATGLGFVAYRAGERAARTAPAPPVAAQPTVVTAKSGVLLDAGPVQVTAKWVPVGTVLNRKSGTVTRSSLALGRRVTISSGDLVYDVDGVAAVVMAGDVPAYRDLGPSTQGADVAQFQRFLASAGDFTGTSDGTWGASTTYAWQSWRAAHQLGRMSNAPLGSIVFVPKLPFVANVDPKITVGGIVADGDTAFDVLGEIPRFTITTTPGSTPITAGLTVTTAVGGTKLSFTTTSRQTTNDQGNIDIELQPSKGLACARWCDSIPTDQVSQFPGTVTRAGPKRGVIVPVGAIHSGANADLFVVGVDGGHVPVTIVLQVGADAIVTGVADGTRLLLPSTPG